MTIVPLALPARSNPSRFGYEGESRLINAYSEPLGSDAKAQFAVYATEGLDTYVTPSSDGGIKCLFPTENYLYGVAGRKVFAIDVNLAVTILATLTVAGDSFMDQNRRSPTPEVGLVSNAEYRVITGVAIALVTTNLIAPPTSISSRDGYLIMTQNFGRYQITAEDNATSLSLTDFGKAQRVADEIVRVMATETDIILFGTRSMEWHANQPTGAGVFPFVPVAQKNVGLIGVKAATRLDDLIGFVANDGTVRLVEGYGASIISTPAVQRAIGAVTDKSTIEATSWNSLSTGHKFIAFSCDAFTWVYDLTTQNWHERKSKDMNRWRVSHVCEWNGLTVAGDYASGELYLLNGALATESGEDMIMSARVLARYRQARPYA